MTLPPPYVTIPVAMVLLGLPLIGARRLGYRSFEMEHVMGSANLRGRVIWSVWPLMDAVRAFAGAWLMRIMIAPPDGMVALGAVPAWWVFYGVALVVTCSVQLAYRRDESEAFMLPVAHIVGVAFGALPLTEAALAVALAAVCGLALRSALAFSFGAAASTAIIGSLGEASPGLAGVVAAHSGLPLLAALCLGQRLGIAVPLIARNEAPSRDVPVKAAGAE